MAHAHDDANIYYVPHHSRWPSWLGGGATAEEAGKGPAK